jgi:hypothetical protein
MDAEVKRDQHAPGVDSREHIVATRRILAAILATTFVSGLVTGVADARQLPEPDWWTLLSAFLMSFLTFVWFRRDRDARGLRRSTLVNLAILLLEPVAIFVYILVSRPRGQKLRGLGRLLGFFLLMLLAAMLGMMAAFGLG